MKGVNRGEAVVSINIVKQRREEEIMLMLRQLPDELQNAWVGYLEWHIEQCGTNLENLIRFPKGVIHKTEAEDR